MVNALCTTILQSNIGSVEALGYASEGGFHAT